MYQFGFGLFFFYYRLVTVIALSPFLVRTGYGFSWRWAAVCVWGGTKGAFCLSLTLMAFQSDDLDEEQVREKVGIFLYLLLSTPLAGYHDDSSVLWPRLM